MIPTGGVMDTSKVAKTSGLPVSTLRFYEEKGLIVSYARKGLTRLLHDNVLEQLALVFRLMKLLKCSPPKDQILTGTCCWQRLKI